MTCGVDGAITSWNPAAERLFGYGAAEVIGKPLTLLVPRDRVPEIGASAFALSSGRAITQLDTVRLRKDGSAVEVSASVAPIVDSAGSALGLVAIYRDITERRCAERDNARRAALNTLLSELAAAAGEASSPKDALAACVRRLCAYGGWQVGHAITLHRGSGDLSLWHVADGMQADEFIAACETLDYAAAEDDFVGRALQSQAPRWIEDLQKIERSRRAAAMRAAGLRCGLAVPVAVRGETVGLFEFFAVERREPDRLLLEAMPAVTAQLARAIERAAALEQVRAGERQMRLIADYVPAMIAYFDTELRCRYANRRYCEFHGVDPQRALGMTLREITGEEIYGLVRHTVAQVIGGKQITTRRAHPGGKDGVTHVEIRCVPDMSRDDGLRGFYALMFDVSEQVRVETALRANEARLRAILDNEPACVKLVAADGTLLEINRA
ncbi:MAG TPA: PAS domain S-box protein, partial [Burkholderiaceae bacterium]|nr:PAS domain S-box protein [Burkholderiaceae bacterium]